MPVSPAGRLPGPTAPPVAVAAGMGGRAGQRRHRRGRHGGQESVAPVGRHARRTIDASSGRATGPWREEDDDDGTHAAPVRAKSLAGTGLHGHRESHVGTGHRRQCRHVHRRGPRPAPSPALSRRRARGRAHPSGPRNACTGPMEALRGRILPFRATGQELRRDRRLLRVGLHPDRRGRRPSACRAPWSRLSSSTSLAPRPSAGASPDSQ